MRHHRRCPKDFRSVCQSKYDPSDIRPHRSPKKSPAKKKSAKKKSPTEKKKRAPTEYNKFMSKELKKLKEEKPDMDNKDRFEAAAKAWKKSPQNPKRKGSPKRSPKRSPKKNTHIYFD